MSTLDYTASTGVNRILLGRRIWEILNEKEGQSSLRKFAERVGINRETFRMMVAGVRPIQPSQLEMIVNELGISMERLKQLDTLREEQEVVKILQAKHKTITMLSHAHTLASELVSYAIGMTERAVNLLNLGRVQYYQQRFEDAHSTWIKALEYAEQIYNEYKDGSLLHLVTANLMLTYTMRNEFSNIEMTLGVIENELADNPEAMGFANYARMKLSENRGAFDQAKKYAYLSLDSFRQTHDAEQIGKAMINVAHFEFQTEEYERAANVLRAAIDTLDVSPNFKILAVKEYVKTLIRVRDYRLASQVIEQYSVQAKEFPDLYGKLEIMHSISKDDCFYAESVVADSNFSPQVRYLACKYLIGYFSLKEDSELMMKYYKKGSMLLGHKDQYFDEGEL